MTAEVLPWAQCVSPAGLAAWDALAARAAEPNPFYESWFLQPALSALDPDGDCRLVRVWQGDRLIGLLPLIRRARYYRWPVPHLGGWLHGNAFVGTPLIDGDASDTFWGELLDWADRAGGGGLFLHICELPLDGPVFRALDRICHAQHRQLAVVHRYDRALLQRSVPAAEYLAASLSGKKRKELRRQFNRLNEVGEVAIRRDHDDAGLAEWTEAFLALEQAGWKGAGGSALASQAATAGLFRQLLAGAAARGRLERLTLSVDRQPVAMLATLLAPPGAFSFKTAFDERYARFSPGVLLQRENLAMLDNPAIRWTDSCAAADHPMIDHIWRERRTIGRVSIAIGGGLRRLAFHHLIRSELARNPTGIRR